jgi:DNA (cytosine-5)-methyltransferase 1
MNRVHDVEGLSPTIQTLQGGSREPKIVETRKLGLHEIGEQTDLSHCLLSRDYKGLSTYPQTGVVEVYEGGLPIREATKQGYAIATEGDAVNFTQPNSETRRGRVGKQIANTLEVNCNQGVVIPEWIPSENDVMRTLRQGGADTLTPKHNCDHIHDGYRIRKLTPLECWRLQGFTDEQFQKCKDAGVSDSQLYKQAGNAVTVNVIEALGKALLAYDIQNH